MNDRAAGFAVNLFIFFEDMRLSFAFVFCAYPLPSSIRMIPNAIPCANPLFLSFVILSGISLPRRFLSGCTRASCASAARTAGTAGAASALMRSPYGADGKENDKGQNDNDDKISENRGHLITFFLYCLLCCAYRGQTLQRLIGLISLPE